MIKPIQKLRIFTVAVLIFMVSAVAQGQWDPNGNPLTQTGILGVTTNFDILFQTDGINRMQLMESGNTTIDGYTKDYDGHLGLSLTPGFFGTGTGSAVPFSLLHLNGTGNNASGPQVLGYRDCLPAGL